MLRSDGPRELVAMLLEARPKPEEDLGAGGEGSLAPGRECASGRGDRRVDVVGIREVDNGLLLARGRSKTGPARLERPGAACPPM